MGATVLMGAGQLDPCPVELICPALLGTFASSLGGGGGSLLRDKHTVNVDLAPLSSPPRLGAEDHPSILCNTIGTASLRAVPKHLKSLFKANARELCRMWNP